MQVRRKERRSFERATLPAGRLVTRKRIEKRARRPLSAASSRVASRRVDETLAFKGDELPELLSGHRRCTGVVYRQSVRARFHRTAKISEECRLFRLILPGYVNNLSTFPSFLFLSFFPSPLALIVSFSFYLARLVFLIKTAVCRRKYTRSPRI